MTVPEAINYQRNLDLRKGNHNTLKICARQVLEVQSGHSDVEFPRFYEQANRRIRLFMQVYDIHEPIRKVCDQILSM